jgi:hypothetical protein
MCLVSQATEFWMVVPAIFSIIIAGFFSYVQKCVSVYMNQAEMPKNSEVYTHSELWALSMEPLLFHPSGNCILEMVPRFLQNL